MKYIVATSAILALFAGAVSADERPDIQPTAAIDMHTTMKVPAESVYSEKELSRAGLTAGDTVDLTVFPTTGLVDAPSRDG